MVKRVLQKDADRRVKRVVKARLPFHPNVEKPRAFSMRDRQKAWIISGLRHLKAPMEGRAAVPFDVDYSAAMDLLTPEGFSNALYHMANTNPGSGSLTAPVCSTFVIVSRGSTRRSPRNPLGRKDSEAVRKGNILACRAFILCFIAAAKAIWFVLEQPASSCMEHHPLFQHMARLVPLFKYSMRMGDHGGPTLKPTLLYSSHRCIEGLNAFKTTPRLRPKEVTVRYLNSQGQPAWHGGKDMKTSQNYPRQFGVSLAKLRTLHSKANKRKAIAFLRAAKKSDNKLNCSARMNKAWTDQADLGSVIQFLSQR
ncbi:unnamed protein product [Durusdinium trenchii]|uniref:Uncharacterized protein n=1 Tax=Durusdinium trenchii TaxID=1381693 RepID=A0ABP0JG28_9DINO